MNLDILNKILDLVDCKSLTSFLLVNKGFNEFVPVFKRKIFEFMFQKVYDARERGIKRLKRVDRFTSIMHSYSFYEESGDYFWGGYFTFDPRAVPDANIMKATSICIDDSLPCERYNKRAVNEVDVREQKLMLDDDLDEYMRNF